MDNALEIGVFSNKEHYKITIQQVTLI